MGEYLELHGQQVKLGTCESLYYARLDDLKKLNAPGVSQFLNPAHGYRYRFPFPEEDGVKIGEYEPFEKGRSLPINATTAPGLLEYLTGPECEHYESYHYMTFKGGGHGFNVCIPCPLSHDHRSPQATPGLSITQQKQIDGEVWTVVECAYCGAAFRLEYESAVELAESARLYWSDGYGAEIASRILAGYRIPEPA